ncbi:FAD-binding oxidoreductase [Cryobacterium psychrophilum]|uniref:D-amino-acid oxidase n=1 Tax=Cryobacterium psychrophilum TaxID=41988 RepID=A0A4Y8KKI0_9MICO|nr:FAD-binding oxidoreductase [Cryobacterium psychrophilum]
MTVIGGGVIGLTCALQLARSGYAVTVVAAEASEDTCSAVSAALWLPFEAAPKAAVIGWSRESFGYFAALSLDSDSGVTMNEGIALYRSEPHQDWWTAALEDSRDARPDELLGGAAAGTVCTMPFVKMPLYLPWLQEQCRAAGIRFVRERVQTLHGFAPDSDCIVVAAGLGSAELMADEEMTPIRGQVVRLSNPGLTDWILDDENPHGMLYIFPRGEDVICGGTTESGSWNTEEDPATTEAILRRARALVPALEDAEVLNAKVGLRPFRSATRVETAQQAGRTVVTCYGHGGAGVTMSWGCADEVVRLVRAEAGPPAGGYPAKPIYTP